MKREEPITHLALLSLHVSSVFLARAFCMKEGIRCNAGRFGLSDALSSFSDVLVVSSLTQLDSAGSNGPSAVVVEDHLVCDVTDADSVDEILLMLFQGMCIGEVGLGIGWLVTGGLPTIVDLDPSVKPPAFHGVLPLPEPSGALIIVGDCSVKGGASSSGRLRSIVACGGVRVWSEEEVLHLAFRVGESSNSSTRIFWRRLVYPSSRSDTRNLDEMLKQWRYMPGLDVSVEIAMVAIGIGARGA